VLWLWTPTSPRSGGALLGDRIRLQHLFPNENLFFRSFANKGALGGLSPILMESVKILEVAGFDYIFLETVGIGQSEVDITHFADVVVLVLSPGLGDEFQFLKGGIMEIADILVMNKWICPVPILAWRLLKLMLGYLMNHQQWCPSQLLNDAILMFFFLKSISAMRKSKIRRSSKKYVKSETKLCTTHG